MDDGRDFPAEVRAKNQRESTCTLGPGGNGSRSVLRSLADEDWQPRHVTEDDAHANLCAGFHRFRSAWRHGLPIKETWWQSCRCKVAYWSVGKFNIRALPSTDAANLVWNYALSTSDQRWQGLTICLFSCIVNFRFWASGLHANCTGDVGDLHIF